MIPAYPLQWPAGWKRTPSHNRQSARFGERKTRAGAKFASLDQLSVNDGVTRVRDVLTKMGVTDDDLVISTNLQTRLDGFPRSNLAEPTDVGVAVYWRVNGETRCMAIDRYDRTADNLAAIAATLDAMRAIERHGGAEVLDRAFTGFTALPPPACDWATVLGVPAHEATDAVRIAWQRLRSRHHPDKGGSNVEFQRVNDAWDRFRKERGISA